MPTPQQVLATALQRVRDRAKAMSKSSSRTKRLKRIEQAQAFLEDAIWVRWDHERKNMHQRQQDFSALYYLVALAKKSQ
jgi:hypothetical protein